MKNYVLILGGQLRNSGAQAMTLIVVSYIKQLMPSVEPVLISSDDAAQPLFLRMCGRRNRKDLDNLSFKIIWGGIDLLPVESEIEYRDNRTGASLKRALAKKIYKSQLDEAKHVLDNTRLCIDISGFQFGAQWGYDKCRRYLRRLELLRQFNIPTYILPQSFGPFSFDDEKQTELIRAKAFEVLRFPRIICAREQQGLNDILELCPSARCVLEEDLVVTNPEIDLAKVFDDPSQVPRHAQIETERNVAIIPNTRAFEHGDGVRLFALYGAIMEGLIGDGYNIYVVRHSEDDGEVCASLKGLFAEDERVALMCEERYCFQYEELFARCDFLVASRFHSIVHAYRQGVPCVALGWATKYQELLGRFGQGRYVHDVRSLGDEDATAVFASVRRMEARHAKESEVIMEHLRDIRQGPSVFERVAADYAGLVGR